MPDLRTDVEIIVADVAVEESLAIMCQQGLVILNCVGPVSVSLSCCEMSPITLASSLSSFMLSLSLQYRFYGEPVVKACVANGAHYLDICGEPQVGKHTF